MESQKLYRSRFMRLTMAALLVLALVFTMTPIEKVDAATKKVKLSYYANKGKFTAKKYSKKKSYSIKITKGKKIGELPKVKRTGYKLKGWYTKTANGKKVTKKTEIKKSTKVYAQWTAKKYTLNFNVNGGDSIANKSKKVTYSKAYGALPTPTREGYDFLGWFTAKNGGKKVTKNTKLTKAGNVTIYAQWIEDLATVKYASKVPTTNEIFGYIEDLSKIGVPYGGRIPGTQGGVKAQQYLVNYFNDLGLEDVHVIPSRTRVWKATDWDLTVEGKKIDSYPMYKSFADNRIAYNHEGDGVYGPFGTDEEFDDDSAYEASREIVYVSKGASADFNAVGDVEGKIVVADLNVTYGSSMASYVRAQDKGAAGFIGILNVDCNHYNPEDMTCDYGNFAIPGLYVGNTDGKTLKSLIAKTDDAEAILKLYGFEKEANAGAVAGILPGNDPEDESMIMAHSHYDSSTPEGAVQDGSGMATVMASASFFSKIPQKDRDRNILFVGTDTHMSDYDTHDAVAMEYLGAVWANDEDDTPETGWVEYEEDTNVLADLCVEHIGKTAEIRNGEFFYSGKGPSMEAQVIESEALETIATEEVEKYHTTGYKPDGSADPVRVITGDSMVTDGDIFYGENWGIPVISLMGYSAPYMYDNCDTLDKVAKKDLVPVQEIYSNILWRLLSLDEDLFDDREHMQ